MTDTNTVIRTPTPEPPPERKKLVELSATQLVGGALAAMTSAVIGARLGVAGTVIGAAIGSLVAGVAGSLYTASLKHTKSKLTSAFVGKVGDTPVELETVSDDTFVSDRTRVSEQRRVSDQTWHWDTSTESAAANAPVSADPVAADVVVDDGGRQVRQWPWKGILVSTAAVFLLAIAGITGYELISGQSVSGGEGTTIGQVSEGRSGGSQTAPSEAPSSTPSSTSTPSSAPSASSEPSSSATSEPTEAPSASSEPTETSEPTTSSEPSASASAAAGETDGETDGDDSSAANSDGGAVAGG